MSDDAFGLIADMLLDAYLSDSPNARRFVAHFYRNAHHKNPKVARLLRRRCLAFVQVFVPRVVLD